MPSTFTPRPTHGNINTVQQTRVGQLSGGEFATTLITTDNSTRTDGHLLMTDSHGNAVDSGVPVSGLGSGGGPGTTHAEALTDGASNLLFANGDLIYVVGIPN